MGILTRSIWILSLVSLFTDFASEMLYPVMPVYLNHIGFSVVLIGILEGFAEAVAGMSKGYFGKLSDSAGKRRPFVQWGYGLSSLSKPMLAVSIYPVWIFAARTLDRLGKGIRTGARDALLSDQASPQNKGKVFGFHRSMDTAGAVLGPIAALLYLYWYPGDYRTLFLIAFVPGLLAVLLTFLLDERSRPVNPAPIRFFSFLHYWKESPPAYRRVTGGLIAFALVNSSDVFLLLRIKSAGMDDVHVIGAYIFYNAVYAAAAYPIGHLADRIGLSRTLIAGLILFGIVYVGMGIAAEPAVFYGLLFVYGIYAASTEGISKAFITNLCRKDETATAIGTYTAFQSIASLIASTWTGWVWYAFGAEAALGISGILAVVIAGYFWRYLPRNP